MPISRTWRTAALAALLLGAAAGAPARAHAQPELTVCTGQPLPAGYVVVAAAKGGQCPGYYDPGHNTVTLRIPGDTVTVCSALTPALPGYVVTAQGKRGGCPGYYDPGTNSATWQRIPQVQDAPAPAQAAAGGEVMQRLGPWGRFVMVQLEEAEESLGLREATHFPWHGVLNRGATLHLRVDVDAGVRETFLAVCDQDCDALAMRILTPDGRVAGEETGPQPSIHLDPEVSGGWTVEVTLSSCSAASCRVAVGVYDTPSRSEIPPQRPRRRPGARP